MSQLMVTEHFSPLGGCEAAIVDQVTSARVEILIQIFNFTSQPIAAALARAMLRGIRVSIIADPVCQTEIGSKLAQLQSAGATVLIDSKHHLQHNKVMIVDQLRVVTGSFNFSYEAEHGNAENLVVIHNAKTALAFLRDFNTHAQHSVLMVVGK